MFITYPCPKCLFELFANDHFVGKHITCKMCAQESVVPPESVSYTAAQQKLKWEFETNYRTTGKWGPRSRGEDKHRSQQRTGRDYQQSSNDNKTAIPPSSDDIEIIYGQMLELKGKVTFDDVKRQYKRLALQYHPDKVSHLGPKLKKVAEDEMKNLNQAFDYFKTRYGK